MMHVLSSSEWFFNTMQAIIHYNIIPNVLAAKLALPKCQNGRQMA